MVSVPSGNTLSPKATTVPGIVSRFCAVSSSLPSPQVAMSPAPTSTTKPPAVAIVAVVAAGGLARPRVSVTVSVTV